MLFLELALLFACAVAQNLCNGYVENCNKKYSQLSYTGAHDSFALRETSVYPLFGNQFYNASIQLQSGIRMLSGQGHSSPNPTSPSGIDLCHTDCSFLDAGSLESYLTNVTKWVIGNPRNVITLLWVNYDDLPVTQWALAYESTGLANYSFVPPSNSSGVLGIQDWPTLQEMIDKNQRVVTFMDAEADCSQVPYILDEFSNVFETPYEVVEPEDFVCNVNRPPNTQPGNKLYVMNHFLDYNVSSGNLSIQIPNVTYAYETNALSGFGSLGSQAQNCSATFGRQPNFLLVDFFDQGGGSSIEESANLNNVSYKQSVYFPGAFYVSSHSGANSMQASALTIFMMAIAVAVIIQ